MSRTARHLTVLAALAVAAAPAPDPAAAATIGPPKVLKAGQRLPIDFTTGLRRGRPIPRGHEVISRSVALAPRESTPLTMRCRSSAPRIRTLGLPESGPIGFQLIRPIPYGGRRQVTVRVYLAPDDRETGARGTAYVVCRRGSR